MPIIYSCIYILSNNMVEEEDDDVDGLTERCGAIRLDISTRRWDKNRTSLLLTRKPEI